MSNHPIQGSRQKAINKAIREDAWWTGVSQPDKQKNYYFASALCEAAGYLYYKAPRSIPKSSNPFMLKIYALMLLLFVVAGCRSKEKTYDFKSHPFDNEVIARLPLYDSLSQLLLANFASLQDEIREHSSFDYARSGGAKLVNPKLPPEAAEKINGYMTQLGDKFLKEFSVYKDSSIKYSVRDTNLEGYDIIVRERLSYLPKGGNMQRREPPNKDTILSPNWQYWIRFDDKPLF